VSDRRWRGNSRRPADQIVQRIGTIQVLRHIAGQPYFPLHNRAGNAQVQLDTLPWLEIQRHARPRAEAFVVPWSSIDAAAHGNGRYARELKAALRTGNRLHRGIDSRPAEAIEANRLHQDRGSADG